MPIVRRRRMRYPSGSPTTRRRPQGPARWRHALTVAFAIAAMLAPPAVISANSVSAQVDALQREDIATQAFDALLARIDAEGTPTLKARAYALRCQRAVGADPEAVRAHADAGIALARNIGASAELGGLLLCRGYIHERADRGDAAIADYSAAIDASNRAGESGDAAQAHVLRGELRHQRGQYADALSDLQNAYRRYVALDNEPQQSYALNAIANFYADPRVADYGKALRYYRQLLVAHRTAGRTGEIATARFNIASTLGRLEDYERAIPEFRAALAAYEAEDNVDSVVETQHAMAAMLLRMARPAEALKTIEEGLRRANPGDESAHARLRLLRGSALRALGRAAEALTEFDAAEPYFVREKNLRFLEHLSAERAEAHAALEQWQQAFAARSRQQRLSRELDKRLEQDVTARMRVQFDSERTERQNAALQRESALRLRSLRDAQRIRGLQTAVIALGGSILLGILWLAWRFRRRASEMTTLAMTDELTGLLNRRAALDRLRRRLRATGGSDVPLMIFDIDRFKSINDERGHDIGDAVLCEVGAVVRDALGDDGVVGRIGGEEFLVVLDDGDRDAAMGVGERLRAAVEAVTFGERAPGLRTTISVGVSAVRPGRDRLEDGLKRADLALYDAKENGRNRVRWRDPG